MNETEHRRAELVGLTAEIVSAFVSSNAVPVADLPDLISSIHRSLSGLEAPIAPPASELVPAVNPKKSVFPDYIVCLEDGKKFKSLKRHLRTDFGLTPEAYRDKWKLPNDYPMVAPNYAAKRSALAKASGLGRAPAKAAARARPTRRSRETEVKA